MRRAWLLSVTAIAAMLLVGLATIPDGRSEGLAVASALQERQPTGPTATPVPPARPRPSRRSPRPPCQART